MPNRLLPCLLLASTLLAQTPPPAAAFEAASLKPSPAWNGSGMPPIPSMNGGPETSSPTRLTARNIHMLMLIRDAFEVRTDQISAPSWATSFRVGQDSYDIDAVLPPGATKEEFIQMLRNLLVERFHIRYHRETKEGRSYALTIAGKTHRLKPAGTAARLYPASASALGLRVKVTGSNMIMQQLLATTAELASYLKGPLRGAVSDETGLTGKYDITLEYRNPDAAPSEIDENAAPDIFKAVEMQLGLKLVARTAPVEMLIIDQIDRTPAIN